MAEDFAVRSVHRPRPRRDAARAATAHFLPARHGARPGCAASTPAGRASATSWSSRTFPFLDHFLADAEAFWATGEFGRVGFGPVERTGRRRQGLPLRGLGRHGRQRAVPAARVAARRRAAAGDAPARARRAARTGAARAHARPPFSAARSQLRRAKEVAEVGAAARASLLATVSHEVRTPVHAIIGLAGLLLDSSLPPGQARFLSLIRSSSETLLAVLNDMLDASRLEAGAWRSRRGPSTCAARSTRRSTSWPCAPPSAASI